MAMQRKPAAKQPDLWIATSDLARTPGHPFYDRLNSVPAVAKFNRSVEERCEKYDAER